jgi:hypothetical protein
MNISVYALIIQGTLVFNDQDLDVNAYFIMANNGNLIIGTPE